MMCVYLYIHKYYRLVLLVQRGQRHVGAVEGDRPLGDLGPDVARVLR